MSAADSIDVREGGRWTPAQRLKNDAIWIAVSVALAIAVRLPRRLLRAAGAALGAVAHRLAGDLRRTALENVARAFPELDLRARRALVRRSYRTLGRHLGDAVASLDPRRPLDPLPFAPGSREVLEAAIAEGRGVLFASAHLGPWERVAGTLAASGIPLTVVAREPYDPRLRGVYDRLRRDRGVASVFRGARGAGPALLRALRSGGVLGVPMDLSSRVPSIDAPFLGAPAPTATGPARLALRTGAAVVVGTAAPGLSIRATRIDTDDLRDDAAGIRALTERLNDELGRRIRALPEHWVWMHPRFGAPRRGSRSQA